MHVSFYSCKKSSKAKNKKREWKKDPSHNVNGKDAKSIGQIRLIKQIFGPGISVLNNYFDVACLENASYV